MAIEIRHSFSFRSRILIISDNPENQEALSRILSAEHETESASSAEEAFRKYREGRSYSLNILDLDLPDMNPYDFIRQFRATDQFGRTPIVAIMARFGNEAEALRAGASDFIRKPFQPEVILARCERIIELSMDRLLIRQVQDDPLTGLYNREFFFEYVRQIESNARDLNLDALVINVEHFHLINELYGRDFGNQLLIRLADAIRDTKAEIDSIAGRIDADTFYLSCRHQESYDGILSEIIRKVGSFPRMQHIRLRTGIYQNVDLSKEPEVWFDRAKKACDQIREDYTRNYNYYDSALYEKTIFEEKLIHGLHQAMEEGRIVVYFQPKFDIRGGKPRICAAEALVRWDHPDFGLIPPGDFIPLFEKNGLVQQLDRCVWDQAARQVSLWKKELGISLPVSVNVSHVDIYDTGLESLMEGTVKKYGLTPDLLHLEITESFFTENTEQLVAVISRLRDKGFQVEMDDFGSGYSSLNMLSVLPFDILKLDRVFIRNMMENEKGLRTVEAILELAKVLQVSSIAEGVETEEEYRLLRGMGCDIIQGFYFCCPLPPDAFEEFLKKHLLSDEKPEGADSARRIAGEH